MTHAVIFDLDGTLVDSLPDIHAAAAEMLEGMGLPPLDLPVVASFVGNGVHKLVERCLAAHGLPAEAIEAAFPIFRDAYGRNPSRLTRPYEGVEAALDRLAGQGHPLGVCTNKTHALAVAVLAGTGLAPRFGCTVGGDTLAVMKPDPAPLVHAGAALGVTPERIVYVGDSETDAATAEALGVPFLLFTRGYRRKPAEQIPALARFDDFAALPGLVARALAGPVA